MKIAITGATGFIGVELTKKILNAGHQVKILTRSRKRAMQKLPANVDIITWDAPHGEIPAGALNDIDGLINLMGENIGDKRWCQKQKNKLRDSRIKAGQKLATAIQRDKPDGLNVLISTSAIGYYPVNTATSLDENHSSTDSFLATLCQDWEQAAFTIKAKRIVILRLGVVLGQSGGALAKLLPIFKLGFGGPILPGTQIMSWIHRQDLVNLYVQALSHPQYNGIINAVAPHPISNRQFSKALARTLSRPAFFPVPPIAIKLAMGEMSTLILDSQIVVSKKLAPLGFEFTYENIDSALKNL